MWCDGLGVRQGSACLQVQVATSYTAGHCLALTKQGEVRAAWPVGEWLQVWAWGRGELGQLGLDAAALEMLCSSSDEGPGFAPVPQLVDQTGIQSDEEIAQVALLG